MNNNTSQQKSQHPTQALPYLLLVINAALLAFTLPEFLSGTPDSYLNEHARLVSSSVCGIFLMLALIFDKRSKMQNEIEGLNRNLYLLFITLSFWGVGIQFWLGM